MPRRRPTSADYTQFVDRMTYCASRVGNVNQLSLRSGIPQSTIRSYFDGAEPPRDFLIAIARAANVSVSWLVAGIEPHEVEAEAPIPVNQDLLAAFRNQLDDLANRREGYEGLAKLLGVGPKVLDEIRFARAPTIFELAMLARKTASSASVLLGIDIQHNRMADEWEKSGKGGLSVGIGKSRSVPIKEALKMGELINTLLNRLNDGPHRCFTQLDDTMEPTISMDDVVIIREQNTITKADCYLIQSSGRQFMARAVPVDDGILLSYDNTNYHHTIRLNYDPVKHLCLGRMVARLTASKVNFRQTT